MKYLISCIWSNELLVYDEDSGEIERRIDVSTRSEFDRLHSVRVTDAGWLLSSTYAVHLHDGHSGRHLANWSHPRLSNVHSVDYLSPARVVIANTGLDELLFCRLEDDGTMGIEGIFDAAAWAGNGKKVEVLDRRDQPRVRAGDDHTHINCANPCIYQGRPCLASSLFHSGTVLIIDAATREVVRSFTDMGRCIHSSYLSGDSLFVCSSQDSEIRRFDPMTGEMDWRWVAPGGVWTRSAQMVDEGSLVFVAERVREEASAPGYLGRLDLVTGELMWQLRLDQEGPFDVQVLSDARL